MHYLALKILESLGNQQLCSGDSSGWNISVKQVGSFIVQPTRLTCITTQSCAFTEVSGIENDSEISDYICNLV